MHLVGARSRVATALVDAAVAGREPPQLLEAGVPLARASVGALLLHPLLDAKLVTWCRGSGTAVEDTPRPAVRGNENWRRSPFYQLLLADEHVLRRRLELREGTDELAVLAELAAQGATDYLALRTALAGIFRPLGLEALLRPPSRLSDDAGCEPLALEPAAAPAASLLASAAAETRLSPDDTALSNS